MRKRWFLVGVVLLLVPGLLGGCGVAQEQHDAVVAERNAAQAEAASLQSDLDTAQAGVSSLTSDLDAAQVEAESLTSDLDAAQVEAESLASDLDTAQAEAASLRGDLNKAQAELEDFNSDLTSILTPLEGRVDLVSILLELGYIEDEIDAGLITQQESEVIVLEIILDMQAIIDDAYDAELSQHWDDFWDAAMQDDIEKMSLYIVMLKNRLIDVLTDDIEAMRAMLAN